MTDQVFEPGDKVMRVAHKKVGPNTSASPPEAWYGKILCVERCFVKLDGTHGCTFVGIQIPRDTSWSTSCFRKVEDIRLCAEIVRKASMMSHRTGITKQETNHSDIAKLIEEATSPTRLTNAFSKKVSNHAHAVNLHMMHYNFARIHQTLRVAPAMAAGIADHVWDVSEIVELLNQHAQKAA